MIKHPQDLFCFSLSNEDILLIVDFDNILLLLKSKTCQIFVFRTHKDSFKRIYFVIFTN